MSKRLMMTVPTIALSMSLGLAGCKMSTENMGVDTKHFEIKGTVVGTDETHGQVTLQHEAVPGLMDAMTMPYQVFPVQSAGEVHPGDRIHARLSVQRSGDGTYRNPFLDEITIVGQAKPDFKPKSNYHVPTEGDAVPDFALTNQDGKQIHLSQFHGKALLITFIYTRCPLGDFCPRMSRNFAAINKILREDKGAYEHTALLSISFDPAYDTPSVLKAYGNAYTGGEGFKHWQFAAADKSSLDKMEQFFNLGATPDSNNTIQHSLSTVLIGPAGKVAAWYPGTEWDPSGVATRMKALGQAKPAAR